MRFYKVLIIFTIYGLSSFNQLKAQPAQLDIVWENVGGTGITDGDVFDLHHYNGNIYAAGDFNIIVGNNFDLASVWDGSNWSNLGIPAINFNINSIYRNGGTTYIGGDINRINGNRSYILKKEAGFSEWQMLAEGVTDEVYDMLQIGSELYVGGAFNYATQDNGQEIEVNNVAVFNDGIWYRLGEGNKIGLDGRVNTIERANGLIYLGGDFDGHYDSFEIYNKIVAYNASTKGWIALDQGLDADEVYDIVDTPWGIIAAGEIYAAVGSSANVYGLARFNGSWNPLPDQPADFGVTYALDYRNGILYVAGDFLFTHNNQQFKNLAAFDGTDWYPLIDDMQGTSTEIHTLEYNPQERAYYIGGRFDDVNGVTASNIAKFSPKILAPAKNEKVIAGEVYIIKWGSQWEGKNLKIDFMPAENFALPVADNVSGTNRQFEWLSHPRSYSAKARIRFIDSDNGDTLGFSDQFRIKGYRLSRVDPATGDYIMYNNLSDIWTPANGSVWPESYYNKFNYSGTDPYTNMNYSRTQGDSVFFKAQSSDFPSWETFVETFGIDASYLDVANGIYSRRALAEWEGDKGNYPGSCMGFAQSNALIFESRDQFFNTFPNFPNAPFPFETQSTDEFKALMHELWYHQTGNPHRDYARFAQNRFPTTTLQQIKTMLLEDDITNIRALNFRNNNGNGGHVVLPYAVERVGESDSLYYVYVYDNAIPDSTNARILVDVKANQDSGSWSPLYRFTSWGGSQQFFLRDPANTYLSDPILVKKSKSYNPFSLSSDTIKIKVMREADIIITDQSGNQTGSTNSGSFANIPGSEKLIFETGTEIPPYGYLLPKDNYSVELQNFTNPNVKMFFFTGNETYKYSRPDAQISETDKLDFENGLKIVNTDQTEKEIRLMHLTTDAGLEKLFVIRGIRLTQNDSVKLESISADSLRLTNYSAETEYALGLEIASAGRNEIFSSDGYISLGSSSSQVIIPSWDDLSGSGVKMLIDNGNDGTFDDSITVQLQVTSVNENIDLTLPTEYLLEQNYPNPFNPITSIIFQIPADGFVSLKIYDAIGREVKTLVNEYKGRGRYEIQFNAADLSSGIYFYSVKSGGFNQVKKMLLLK